MNVNDIKPGDKLYVIEDEELFGYDDDYYDISFPTKIVEKTVREVEKVNVFQLSYVIWFNDATSRRPSAVYKTFEEAHDILIQQQKYLWESNDCDEILDKLLKIKNHLDLNKNQ